MAIRNLFSNTQQKVICITFTNMFLFGPEHWYHIFYREFARLSTAFKIYVFIRCLSSAHPKDLALVILILLATNINLLHYRPEILGQGKIWARRRPNYQLFPGNFFLLRKLTSAISSMCDVALLQDFENYARKTLRIILLKLASHSKVAQLIFLCLL